MDGVRGFGGGDGGIYGEFIKGGRISCIIRDNKFDYLLFVNNKNYFCGLKKSDKMNRILLIFILTLMSLSANSQQITFQKFYDVDPNNRNSVAGGNFVQQTSDGGYILTGQTSLYSLSLIKTNTNGDTIWTRAFTAW